MKRIWQSTPLRLTIALVGLFSIVSLVSLAISYQVAKSTLESTIRETLVKDLAGFRAAPSAAALATLVEAQGRVMDPATRVVGYRDATGRMHGNGTIVRTEAGFEVVALERGEDVAETYFAMTEVIHGGYLTLAASTDAQNALRQTMTTVLLISLLPPVAIALGGGLLIGRRSAKRLRALEGTLGRLTGGDLSARVPKMPGWAGDLAQIGERIDLLAIAQEEKVAALRQVTADIAHDLKTPIQRVSVLLDRAHRAAGDASKTFIKDAEQETKDIAEIFSALLQIAQLEGRASVTDFGTVPLGTLVNDMVELYQPAAEEAEKQLSQDIQNPQTIQGDRTLLGQLLANLIENAIRYGGNEIAVSVNGATLTVSDNGEGIPEDERELVLRRLYRREASRTTQGSGLGLSIVKAVSDLHDVKLDLSDNNPGLAVRLAFPQSRVS